MTVQSHAAAELTGLANEKAHSSLWTRSPGLGTRIVDRTDINISLTSVIILLNTIGLHTLARLGFLAPAPEIQSAWSLWQPPSFSVSPQWKAAAADPVFHSRPGALHTLSLHALQPQVFDRKAPKMRA